MSAYYCKWTKDDDGNWETDCRECYCFEYDFRANHGDGTAYKFCPGCGKEIEVVDPEPLICAHCNGIGEGRYDGSKCANCKGGGTEPQWKEDDV